MRPHNIADLSESNFLSILFPKPSPILIFSAFTLAICLLACSTPPRQPKANAQPNQSAAKETTAETAPSGNLPLRVLADIPLTGGTTRLDYQSFDSNSGRLYIAHLG